MRALAAFHHLSTASPVPPPPCAHAVRPPPAGVSLGGMIVWLWAAADERVAVIAPLIGVQYFGWAVEHDAWHGRVDSIPGLFRQAAEDLKGPGASVDGEVVRAVWQRLLPGGWHVHVPMGGTKDGACVSWVGLVRAPMRCPVQPLPSRARLV